MKLDPRRFASLRQRQIIYKRDGGRCVYCSCRVSFQSFRADHVVPWSAEGKTVVSNLVTSCNPCNRGKDGSSEEEFLELLEDVSLIPRQRGVSNPLIGKSFARYYRTRRDPSIPASYPPPLPTPKTVNKYFQKNTAQYFGRNRKPRDL